MKYLVKKVMAIVILVFSLFAFIVISHFLILTKGVLYNRTDCNDCTASAPHTYLNIPYCYSS